MYKTPQRLYTAGQVRELDRVAIEEAGIDGYELMKRAGLAAWRLLRFRYPRARTLAVYCGSGNNGGDGYVVASLARRAGLEVDLVAVGAAKSDTAKRALADYRAAGGTVSSGDPDPCAGADVVVDALLGTGLERAPAGRYADAVERINRSGIPVLSLDIPSGLHADTGRALEPCVRAAATVTFIGRKLGCFTGDGRAVAGEIVFAGLDVPAEVSARVEAAAELIDPRPGAAALRGRRATAHKGDAGRVLVVGGNHDMPGAACMAAKAAHRGGAGLVYLGTRARPVELVAGSLESMGTEVTDPPDLDPLLERVDVAAVGPGLGRDDWGRALWARVARATVPLVVDADALHWLAASPMRRDDWILTPHPGEAARMLNTSIGIVQGDRIAAARALRETYGGIVVLKGSGTLVLGESLHVCDRGNPGMASGGMGDVLTGLIAAFRGQGMPAEDAACHGVWCHGRAGDLAAREGMVGLTAGDLIDRLKGIVDREDP